MMKKRTIGKLQVILGIALLVATVVWLSYSYSLINEQKNNISNLMGMESGSWDLPESASNESRLIMTTSYLDLYVGINLAFEEKYHSVQYSMAALIVLSVVLVLQGLANLAEENK